MTTSPSKGDAITKSGHNFAFRQTPPDPLTAVFVKLIAKLAEITPLRLSGVKSLACELWDGLRSRQIKMYPSPQEKDYDGGVSILS